MSRSFEKYFDENGILCTMPGYDSGDGSQKMGLYRFSRYLKFKDNPEQLSRETAKFNQECEILESPKKNWYVRSPALGQPWWSNPRTFSRDQQRSLVMAMGAFGFTKRIIGLMWEHLKRFGFYQNDMEITGQKKLADIMGPDHLGEYLRALYMSGLKFLIILWPLLILTDLWAILGLILQWRQYENPDDCDEDNLIMHLLQAKHALPTPISWLHRYIYIKYRPIAGFLDENKTVPLSKALTRLNGPQSALAWKHRPPTAPDFLSVYKEYLDEV